MSYAFDPNPPNDFVVIGYIIICPILILSNKWHYLSSPKTILLSNRDYV